MLIKYNMKILTIFSLLFINIFVESKEIDNKLLKCLVCRSTVKEIEGELAKIDPAREIEIGNYRLDAQGNIIHKKIPLAQSEVHVSDILDNICEKMSDYVRATYKSNGELTILNLISPSGAMNPEMSKVDIIQDDDLNKSLKYYCEGIVEEFEDSIISLFIHKKNDINEQLCTNIANLCNSSNINYDNIEKNDIDEEHDEL
ncbi:protein seele [Apis florea]|uniref:protein seele n=1 Tax=Apis florea TaxID=7463 RepID=UPI0012FEC73B|nr:protein seele [Apis florea]